MENSIQKRLKSLKKEAEQILPKPSTESAGANQKWVWDANSRAWKTVPKTTETLEVQKTADLDLCCDLLDQEVSAKRIGELVGTLLEEGLIVEVKEPTSVKAKLGSEISGEKYYTGTEKLASKLSAETMELIAELETNGVISEANALYFPGSLVHFQLDDGQWGTGMVVELTAKGLNIWDEGNQKQIIRDQSQIHPSGQCTQNVVQTPLVAEVAQPPENYISASLPDVGCDADPELERRLVARLIRKAFMDKLKVSDEQPVLFEQKEIRAKSKVLHSGTKVEGSVEKINADGSCSVDFGQGVGRYWQQELVLK